MADPTQTTEEYPPLTPARRAALIEQGIKTACTELRKYAGAQTEKKSGALLKDAAQSIEFELLRKKKRDERRLTGGE